MQKSLDHKIKALHQTYLNQLQDTLGTYQLTQAPTFTVTGSGCREKSNLMSLPIFRLAISLGLLTHESFTFTIMITASHNPGTDNGIKVGHTNGEIMSEHMLGHLTKLVNSKAFFQSFIDEKLPKIEENLHKKERKLHRCFLGRDCRGSSPQLSQLVASCLFMLGIEVTDLGICTTPEVYSLSRELLEQSFGEVKINVESAKQSYVKQTMSYFMRAWRKVNDVGVEKKRKILLDFSNGSCAVSYLRYKCYLPKHFDISETQNSDFDNPNYQCGAQYFHKNWSLVQSQFYQNYDQCFFFDGDADRVIAKVKGCPVAVDGNYYLLLYVKMLKKISAELQASGILSKQEANKFMNLSAVVTTVTNLGVILELRKQGVEVIIANVGILNLFKQAVNLQGYTIFFQPNGHGGINISKSSFFKAEELLVQHPENLELNLLVSTYKILKNNPRGYGLHNMLMYYLCQGYLQITPEQLYQLFSPVHQSEKIITLPSELDCEFQNGTGHNKQLCQPKQICLLVEQMSREFAEYKIVIRKSETTKCLIRINVQGQDSKTCGAIVAKIDSLICQYQRK